MAPHFGELLHAQPNRPYGEVRDGDLEARPALELFDEGEAVGDVQFLADLDHPFRGAYRSPLLPL